jgi:hypothetical protein
VPTANGGRGPGCAARQQTRVLPVHAGHRRRLGGGLAILAASLAATTAGFGILRLNDFADERANAQLQLRDIGAGAHHLSAF